MRLIDADAFAERMLKAWDTADEQKRADIVAILANIVTPILAGTPTVDAVEVVHGEWIKNEPNTEAMREWHKHGIGKAMSEKSIYWTCSRCGRWGTPSLKYCPNCGAKMDGERKVSE